MKYTINDVLGYTGINYSRQNELRKRAGIRLNKGIVKGRQTRYYTKEQFEKLLEYAGWERLSPNTYSKKTINIKVE